MAEQPTAITGLTMRCYQLQALHWLHQYWNASEQQRINNAFARGRVTARLHAEG